MSDDLEQLTSELSDNDNKDNVEKGDNDVAITADTVEEEKSKLHVNVTDEKNTDELCRENLERQIGDETSAAENEDDNMITTVEFVDKTSVEKEDTDEHVDEIKSKTKGGDGPDDEDRIENEGDKNDETKLIIMTGGEPGDDKASIDEEHDKNVEIKFQVENSDDEIMSDESKSDGNFGETICDQQESSSSNEKVEVEIIKPAAAAAPSTKKDNNNDIEGLMEQKFSGFLQSKINKNLIKQKPEETTTTNAFEKKNEEEPDELQLIYKGLTDPSLSSKKPTGKTAADDNVEKVTTKNLIEVLEDESDDIDVNVPPGLKDGDRNNNSSVVVSGSIISGDVNKPRRMNQTTTRQSQDSGDSLKNKIILNTDTQSRNKQQNLLQNNNREKTRTNKPAMVASSQSSIATNEKEFRIQQQQPRRIADTNTVRNSKSSIQLKIPMITLVKLEDRLQEFEHEPYTDNLKMHLNYFSSKDKNKIDINKIISNDFFIKIEKADDVLPVLGSIVSGAAAKETISSAIEESAKIEAAAANNNNKENQLILLEQQIQEEEAEQPPQELQQQPKRRGRKKGYKKAVVEDEYVTHDTGRKEPVKFSMQTRKRRLKFLPDGSLVCHRYSPPSDRKTESESSQSGSDTDAELNSLLSIDGPPAAKRKYVKKEPPTAEKKRVGRPRKKLSPTETTVTADQQQQQKLFKKSQQNVVSEQIIGLPVADVLSRIFQINDLIRSDLDVRTFKQQATTTAVVTTSSSPIKKCNLMLIKRNEKPAKNGIINATDNKLSSGGGNMRFKYLSTTDKLKLIGFDENNDGAGGNLGGIVAKCKDKIAKYNAIEPNVIRDATSSSFGRIRSVVCPEQKTKSSSGSTASSRKVVFNNKHGGDGNNSNRMIKKDSEIEQLLLPPDKKKSNNNNVVGKTTSVGGSVYSSDDDEHNFDDKDEDYNVDMDDDDYSDSDSKKKKTLVNKSFSDTCDVAMKEVSKKNDEHQKKFYSSCSSSSNNSNNNTAAISSTSANSSSSSSTSNRNNVTPIILNREDNIKKETRTVRTTRGPKKALQLTTDEDDSSFIYNISDADDTMLKLVTKDLHSANSIAKTIYDLMDEVVIDMPTWNLHIMPETNSFCIAQVARGRMGIPILKKSIELDQNFTAKVYVHQLHCKRYDGVYSDERSIVNLIKEIDSLSA